MLIFQLVKMKEKEHIQNFKLLNSKEQINTFKFLKKSEKKFWKGNKNKLCQHL